jgi:hypothetical protein
MAMPWKPKDATKFTKKATSKIAKRQFSDVANSMLKRGESEGAAIRARPTPPLPRGRREEMSEYHKWQRIGTGSCGASVGLRSPQ